MNSAEDIVRELAEWSKRYPRSKTYSSYRQPQMDGELIALEERAKKWLDEQPQSQHNGLIMTKGDEVNALLIGALRFCNEEQRIALRDALIERTPQSQQKQLSDEAATQQQADEVQ